MPSPPVSTSDHGHNDDPSLYNRQTRERDHYPRLRRLSHHARFDILADPKDCIRSPSLTIPNSVPASSQTGTALTLRLHSAAAISLTTASGPTVMTSRVMMSDALKAISSSKIWIGPVRRWTELDRSPSLRRPDRLHNNASCYTEEAPEIDPLRGTRWKRGRVQPIWRTTSLMNQPSFFNPGSWNKASD